MVLNRLKYADFLKALNTQPGSDCPDHLINIFPVIFRYDLFPPPSPCFIHNNTLISILKHNVDICKDLHTNMMQSVGTTMNQSTADRMQEEIMFLALSTTKIRIITGMNTNTLLRLQELSWLPWPPFSRCVSASWSMTNLDQSILKEKNDYRLVMTIRTSWCPKQQDKLLSPLFTHLSLPSHLHP